MKTLFVLLLSVILMTTIASAELLCTANTTSQGKWAVEGIGLSDSNYGNVSGYSATSFGVKGSYGLTNEIDLSLALGSSTLSGLPAGVSSSMTAITGVVKYGFMKESAGAPVSVAAGLGIRSLNQTNSPAANATGTKTGLGIIVSKVMAPFIPYGGVTYATTSLGGGDMTSLELTGGTGIAWSQQGAVFVEYTLQSITPSGSTAYSSPSIGAGVGYII